MTSELKHGDGAVVRPIWTLFFFSRCQLKHTTTPTMSSSSKKKRRKMADCPDGYKRKRVCVEKKATASTRHRQFRQVLVSGTADYAQPSKYGKKFRKADLKRNKKGIVVSRKMSDSSKRKWNERSDEFKEKWIAREGDATPLPNRRLGGGAKRPACPKGERVTQYNGRDLKNPYTRDTRPMLVCVRTRRKSSSRASKVGPSDFKKMARIGDIWQDEEGNKFKILKRKPNMIVGVQPNGRKGQAYSEEMQADLSEGGEFSRVSKAKKKSKKKPKRKSSGKKKKKKKKPKKKKRKSGMLARLDNSPGFVM